MSVAPGARVGPYDVTTKIGAGGPPPFACESTVVNYDEILLKPGSRTR